MAATGKTPILLYGSTTPTNAPAAGNLTNSSDGCEIAINVADKNLFFKDSTNAVNTVPIRQSSASSNGWLSSIDWNTFNNKQPAGTYVTSVTGTAPVVSSGGTTPAISMAAATSSVNGYLTSTDWNTFNNKVSSQWTTSGSLIYYANGVSIGNTTDPGAGYLRVQNGYIKPVVNTGPSASPAYDIALQQQNGTTTYANVRFWNIAQSLGTRNWISLAITDDNGTAIDGIITHPYNGVQLYYNTYSNGDNTASLGTSARRWSVVYAATGTINTSDKNQKQQIRNLQDAELAVAKRCKSLIRAFKFNEAVERKGDTARIHFGVIAQEVAEAFAAEGLNAEEYGVFCKDIVYKLGEDSIMPDEDGKYPDEAVATEQLGIRYEELFAFIIAAL